MALWEVVSPRRTDSRRLSRWPSNFGILILGALLVRVLLPVLAVGLAMTAEDKGWGLLNNVTLPLALELVVALLILDFSIYLQHLLFHYIPWLWRLHAVHHADTAFDVTTGFRFHPFEILLSMLIKLALVFVIGASVVAVVVFEVILNATSLFNHGNVALPARADAWLRWLIVTPDMHRVHHSIVPEETNSNFGFNLPWWDRLLGTYREQPRAGHVGMEIGLEYFRGPQESRLDRLLVQPFKRR